MSTKRKKLTRRTKPFKPTLPQAVAELTAAIQSLASAQMELLQLMLRTERRMRGECDGIPPQPQVPSHLPSEPTGDMLLG